MNLDALADLRWDSPWPAIVGMVAATWLLRMAGYWVIGRFAIGPRMRRALEALPGSIFVAAIVPLALRAGAPGIAAAIAAVVVMIVTRREAFALVAGLASAALLRALGL